jgi:hypothetical protein
VEHKLGTKHVVTNVYEKASPFAEVIPTVEITDENHVTLIFLTAPSLDQYVVVVVSGGGGGGGGEGPWETLALTENWEAGAYFIPAVRTENGGATARLRGVIIVAPGHTATPFTDIAVLPVSCRPSKDVFLPSLNLSVGPTLLYVALRTSGKLEIGATMTSEQQLATDGVTWNLT